MSSRCMVAKVRLVVLAVGTLLLLTSTAWAQHRDTFPGNDSLDQQLEAVLLGAGFAGRIESTLEARLGRRLDQKLADVGRLLSF